MNEDGYLVYCYRTGSTAPDSFHYVSTYEDALRYKQLTERQGYYQRCVITFRRPHYNRPKK